MGDNVDGVLKHFGIPGMRWGHRGKKPSRISEDAARKNQLKKKRVSEMSNAELKALNERLQLERQYKDLSSKDISAGRKFVQDILKDVGKEIVKESVKGIAKDTMKRTVKK